MNAEHRTTYEICWEILIFCKTPRSFTSIVHRCNLNSKTRQDYLSFLTERGYISRRIDGVKTTWVATARASEDPALFARLYQTLSDTAPGFRL